MSVCLMCGQALAVLKMPGGQLPWDLDVDMKMKADQFPAVYERSELVINILKIFEKKIILEYIV